MWQGHFANTLNLFDEKYRVNTSGNSGNSTTWEPWRLSPAREPMDISPWKRDSLFQWIDVSWRA